MPVDKVEFNEEWYSKFVQSTNEKNILVGKISDLLIGKNTNSCLEIGLGLSPHFAENLSSMFSTYTILEKRLFPEKLPEGVEIVSADFETVKIDQKFDVIIASHVIYYFKDKQKAIDKI